MNASSTRRIAATLAGLTLALGAITGASAGGPPAGHCGACNPVASAPRSFSGGSGDDPCTEHPYLNKHSEERPATYWETSIYLRDTDCGQFTDNTEEN